MSPINSEPIMSPINSEPVMFVINSVPNMLAINFEPIMFPPINSEPIMSPINSEPIIFVINYEPMLFVINSEPIMFVIICKKKVNIVLYLCHYSFCIVSINVTLSKNSFSIDLHRNMLTTVSLTTNEDINRVIGIRKLKKKTIQWRKEKGQAIQHYTNLKIEQLIKGRILIFLANKCE